MAMQQMTNVLINPYSAPEMGPFDSKMGTFSLRGDGILCGSVLKLPQICLQTGDTSDLVEGPLRLSTRVASPRLWKLRLAAGLFGVSIFAASMTSFQYCLELSKSPMWHYSVMTAPGIGLLLALGPWSLLAQSVSIRGYIARKQYRQMGTVVLLMLVTGLPYLILTFGPILDLPVISIPGSMFSDLFMTLMMFVVSVNLVRLLEWHWRNTRQRGLVFRAEQVNDGVFLVTGFSSEFLAALRKLPEHSERQPM
jgi:hypothetical protein